MFELNPHKKKQQKEIGKKGVEFDFVTAVSCAGGRSYKFVSPQNRGVSDRIVIFPGQVWFVEIKRETTDLTPLQERFRNFITESGLNHFTVYGKPGIKQFLQEVQKHDRS